MSRRPIIRFSVDPEDKENIERYAKIKGFDKSSSLARMALFAYMRKNPLSEKDLKATEYTDTEIL